MSSRRISDLRPPRARHDGARHAPAHTAQLPLSARPKQRLRLRRRRAYVVFFGGALCAAFFVAAVGAYTTHISRLQVAKIIVSGAQDVPEALVRLYAETVLYDGLLHPFSRTNIFLYPKTAVERTIETSIPRVASVSVRRDTLFAQAVRVTVSERVAHARWCATESSACYLLDANGFVYAESSLSDDGEGYEYRGGLDEVRSPIGQTFLPSRLREVETLLKVLTERGYRPFGASVESERDYIVFLESGALLKLAFGEDVSVTIKHLESVFATGELKGRIAEMEYVNLRFGNRVYYKLRGGE